MFLPRSLFLLLAMLVCFFRSLNCSPKDSKLTIFINTTDTANYTVETARITENGTIIVLHRHEMEAAGNKQLKTATTSRHAIKSQMARKVTYISSPPNNPSSIVKTSIISHQPVKAQQTTTMAASSTSGDDFYEYSEEEQSTKAKSATATATKQLELATTTTTTATKKVVVTSPHVKTADSVQTPTVIISKVNKNDDDVAKRTTPPIQVTIITKTEMSKVTTATTVEPPASSPIIIITKHLTTPVGKVFKPIKVQPASDEEVDEDDTKPPASAGITTLSPPLFRSTKKTPVEKPTRLCNKDVDCIGAHQECRPWIYGRKCFCKPGFVANEHLNCTPVINLKLKDSCHEDAYNEELPAHTLCKNSVVTCNAYYVQTADNLCVEKTKGNFGSYCDGRKNRCIKGEHGSLWCDTANKMCRCHESVASKWSNKTDRCEKREYGDECSGARDCHVFGDLLTGGYTYRGGYCVKGFNKTSGVCGCSTNFIATNFTYFDVYSTRVLTKTICVHKSAQLDVPPYQSCTLDAILYGGSTKGLTRICQSGHVCVRWENDPLAKQLIAAQPKQRGICIPLK